MADDPATAVRTDRRQRVDRALEAIEDVPLSAHDDFKRLVVFVSANFAFRHTQFVRARGGLWRCFFTSVAVRIRSLQILLVLNQTESYQRSPSFPGRKELFMQTSDATGAAPPTIAETVAKLGTDDKTGLTDTEVQERLKKYGPWDKSKKKKSCPTI